MKKSYKVILFVVVITIIIVVNFNTSLNLASRDEETLRSKHSRIKHNNNERNNKAGDREDSGEFINPIDKEVIDNQNKKKETQNKKNNGQKGVEDIESEFEDFDEKDEDQNSTDKKGNISIVNDDNNDNDIEEKENDIDEILTHNLRLELESATRDWVRWVEIPADHITEEKKCHYSNSRDYYKKPMHVKTDRYSNGEKKIGPCDIPCEAKDSDYTDASIYSRSECSKSVYTTLENVPPYSKFDITSTTSLKSDVPIGYFSWHEYHYHKQPVAKVVNSNTGLVAAFISNCGPHKRLDWMKKLQESGIQVDSYGSCSHNKDITEEEKSHLPKDYNGQKMGTMARYKFSMAFENSNTDDYVTEKLFGVLTIGSVPIYDGAPNALDFLPQPNAAIIASDFKTPENLAKHLLYLDGNKTAYDEYLKWKEIGPTDEWLSVIDFSLYSQECRTCIRAADMHRKEVGRVVGNSSRIEQMNLVPNSFTHKDGIVIYVRERFKFWFYAIAIPNSITYSDFVQLLTKSVPHKGKLLKAYDLETKDLIISSKINPNQIIKLKQEQEIELVFVNKDFYWDSFENAHKFFKSV